MGLGLDGEGVADVDLGIRPGKAVERREVSGVKAVIVGDRTDRVRGLDNPNQRPRNPHLLARDDLVRVDVVIRGDLGNRRAVVVGLNLGERVALLDNPVDLVVGEHPGKLSCRCRHGGPRSLSDCCRCLGQAIDLRQVPLARASRGSPVAVWDQRQVRAVVFPQEADQPRHSGVVAVSSLRTALDVDGCGVSVGVASGPCRVRRRNKAMNAAVRYDEMGRGREALIHEEIDHAIVRLAKDAPVVDGDRLDPARGATECRRDVARCSELAIRQRFVNCVRHDGPFPGMKKAPATARALRGLVRWCCQAAAFSGRAKAEAPDPSCHAQCNRGAAARRTLP